MMMIGCDVWYDVHKSYSPRVADVPVRVLGVGTRKKFVINVYTVGLYVNHQQLRQLVSNSSSTLRGKTSEKLSKDKGY